MSPSEPCLADPLDRIYWDIGGWSSGSNLVERLHNLRKILAIVATFTASKLF